MDTIQIIRRHYYYFDPRDNLQICNCHQQLFSLQSLCPKFSVRYLARLSECDIRTVMGRTLHHLMQQCKVNQLEDLSPVLIKKSMKYSAVPQAEDWRISLALELNDVRAGKVMLSEFSKSEVEELLAFVCTS